MGKSIAKTLKHGWSLHQNGKLLEAEKIYRSVLKNNPDDADAWCYLGIVHYDKGLYKEAIAAYKTSLKISPNSPGVLNNLGNSYKHLRAFKKAILNYDRALSLKPDYANAVMNKGTAYLQEGFVSEAEECFRNAVNLDQNSADALANLGIVQLLQGQFEEGWVSYRWRTKRGNAAFPSFDGEVWDGASLDGKTILLSSEQGLGDTIHFIRYAKILKKTYDCKIIVAVQPALLPLLTSYEFVDRLIGNDVDPPTYDTWSFLLDIPGILGHDHTSIPSDIKYLKSNEQLCLKWKKRLGGCSGYKVGIVWSGNPKNPMDNFRSIPIEAMTPFRKLKGVDFINLQITHDLDRLTSLKSCFGLIDFSGEVDVEHGAFMDTAAILENIDLLISCDTAIVHLAGAMGIPTWVVLSYRPDWRWMLNREDSPWYPSLRLFRQPKMDDWGSVFEDMASELTKKTNKICFKDPEDFRIVTTGINRLSNTRHGVMLYNRHDKYIGRSLDLYGEYSEGEVDLFNQLVRLEDVVVEVGSNIGVHTVVLSKLVGNKGVVYAFEPRRIVYQTLCANIALNSLENVQCRCEAVGEIAGTIMVPELDYNKEDNFGAGSLGKFKEGDVVPMITVDEINLSQCSFLKVDADGNELEVLRGAEKTILQHRPILFMENDREEKSAVLIEYILSLGYKLYWHLPRLFNPNNYFNNKKNEFASLVSENMLGIHSSVKSSISGLKPVVGPDSHWKGQ